MTSELKEWEESFLKKLGLKEQLNEFPDQIRELYISLTLFPMAIGREIANKNVNLGSSLLDKELIDRFSMFKSRTQFFFRCHNFWLNKIEESEDVADY